LIVPPPGQHQVRYSGVLAAAAKWRPLVVPPPPPTAESASAQAAAQPAKRRPVTHHCLYRSYVELIRRTFVIDRNHCPRSGGPIKLRAIVTKPESIERILRSLGEATELPPLSPARGPPYLRSRVFRRKPDDVEQRELFHDP
jgi:hypothetical protein